MLETEYKHLDLARRLCDGEMRVLLGPIHTQTHPPCNSKETIIIMHVLKRFLNTHTCTHTEQRAGTEKAVGVRHIQNSSFSHQASYDQRSSDGAETGTCWLTYTCQDSESL